MRLEHVSLLYLLLFFSSCERYRVIVDSAIILLIKMYNHNAERANVDEILLFNDLRNIFLFPSWHSTPFQNGFLNDLNLFFLPLCIHSNSGGQLKTKNGQKYIINHRDDRVLIKKTHFILICVLIAIVMAALALLTYFVFAQR